MQTPLKSGLSFGLTSGTITTLGLMIGLLVGTNSKAAVLAGILTIAVADALSDSMAMHISAESDIKTNRRFIWLTTFATFFAKLFFALSFTLPVIFLDLKSAGIVSVLYGFVLIAVFSFYIAKTKKETALSVITKHLFIMILVVIATYIIGNFIKKLFV